MSQARRRLRRLRLHRPPDLRVPARAARPVHRDRPRPRAHQDVVAHVPGVDTIDHEVVERHARRGLAHRAFEGASVVCNTVGPFISYGHEVAEACLAVGAHYLDTTGEQDWVLEAQDRWGAKFAEAGLLLAPGVAQMYTTGEIAANLALETPGMETLDILVLWKGFPTYASTQTIFTILKADWFHLVNNEYVAWDHTATRECVVPGQHGTALTVPWGGTCHPVWFKNDPRVSTVTVTGGVLDRAVMDGVVATTQMFEEQIRPLEPAEQEAKLAEIAAGVQAGMPPRENPRVNTSVDSVYASGPLGRAHCVIHGNSNYKQTGLLQAYAAYSLLQQPPRRAGLASACQAFGHRELLGVLRSHGLVLKPGADRPRLDVLARRLPGQGRVARPRRAVPGRGGADADLRRGRRTSAGASPARWPRPGIGPGGKVGILSSNDAHRVRVRVRDRPPRRGLVPDQPAQRGRREPRAARALRLRVPAVSLELRGHGRQDRRAAPGAAHRRSASIRRTSQDWLARGRRGRAGRPARRPRDARRHGRDDRAAQGRDAHRPQPRDDDRADADGLPVQRPARVPRARAADPRGRRAVLPGARARRADRRHARARPRAASWRSSSPSASRTRSSRRR